MVETYDSFKVALSHCVSTLLGINNISQISPARLKFHPFFEIATSSPGRKGGERFLPEILEQGKWIKQIGKRCHRWVVRAMFHTRVGLKSHTEWFSGPSYPVVWATLLNCSEIWREVAEQIVMSPLASCNKVIFLLHFAWLQGAPLSPVCSSHINLL